MFKRKQILMVLIIVLMLVFSKSYYVRAGELFTFKQFETIFTVDSNGFSFYNVGIHGLLVNPDEFDNIVMTNPTGTTILDITNNISDAFELEDNGNFFAWSNEFFSKVLGAYTVTVTNSSGISESITLNAEESDFSSAVPIIITPSNYSIINDVTPTLSWEPFASPERSPTEPLSYFGYHIEVESNESHAWRTGVLGNVTSVTYNFNSTADHGLQELIPGKYTFSVSALESKIKEELIYTRDSRKIIKFTVPGAFGDISGDGRIGLEEAIYALRAIAQQSDTSLSYDIDRFTVVGGPAGNSTFIDEFDDGKEPPSGPSGSLTYDTECPFPFLPTDENGGLLNLNKNHACDVSDEFIFEVILKDSNFYINSGVGGSIEGKFKFTNGITQSGFAINVFSKDATGVTSDLEKLFMCVESDQHGNIVAMIDIELGHEEILISETNITNSLIGISDITMRLDISPENVVTASLDFGSNGTFDLTLPGFHTLTFMSGISGYAGVFDAFFDKFGVMGDINGDGRVGLEEAIYALQVVAEVKAQ